MTDRFEERRQAAWSQAGLSSPTPEDVVQVMRDGGVQLCEHAQTQHSSGAYGDDRERNYAYYLWWNELKEAIKDSARVARIGIKRREKEEK